MFLDPEPVLADRDRLAHLASPHLLDSPREEAFDRLTRLAARALRAPVALITLVDDRRQFFKSSHGLHEPWAGSRETPLSHSYCKYVVASGGVVRIDDVREIPELRESLALTDLGLVAYLGVPLARRDGMVLGSCAVAERGPRAWTDDDVRIMEDIAATAMTELVFQEEIGERRRLVDELERARAWFETIMRQLPSGVVVVEVPTARIMFSNQSLERIWRGPLPEFAADRLGPPLRRDGHDLPPDEWPVMRAFHRGEIVPADDFEVTVADGTIAVHRLSAAPIRDASGAVVAVVVVVDDATGRRRLEDELRHSQKMEAVGRLAGGVAHDFNNLLTAILGNAELVLGDLPQGEMREEVADIRTAAERASSLTRQLLAFSRKQMLRPRSIDLNAIVLESGQLLRRVIGEGIALSLLPAEHLWTSRADPTQVEQVLVNLVLNARDAMPRGGSVVVETENRRIDDEEAARIGGGIAPGEYASLVVSDTGTGIEAEVRAHLFEPFFTTKEQGKGTGLGLSTVYGIARQSGGAVLVDTEPGRGSRFTVLFPRVAGDPDPEYTTGEHRAPPPRGHEVVLVAEDEGAVRATIRRVLERHGYTVLEARHGADALLLLERGDPAPALVLSDAVMPEIGGFELARIVAGRWPGLPVLLMSGYSETLLAVDAGEAPLRLVTKPFAADALLHAVREALDERARPAAPVAG